VSGVRCLRAAVALAPAPLAPAVRGRR